MLEEGSDDDNCHVAAEQAKESNDRSFPLQDRPSASSNEAVQATLGPSATAGNLPGVDVTSFVQSR